MSMRAYASCLALAVVALVTWPASPLRAAELVIGSGSVSAGGSTPISLVLNLQPGETVAALSLELSFDVGALVDPPVCTLDPAVAGGGVDKTLLQTALGAGVTRIGIFGFNNVAIPAGTVAACTFDAQITAPAGVTPLLGMAGASDPGGASVAISAAPGDVTVTGDGDGIDVDGSLPACTPGQTTGCSDNCPSVANPGQEDADADGVGDACDLCTDQPDPGQADTDNDGYGNACDCDFDQDGSCGITDFNLFLVDFTDTTDSGNGTDMNADGSVGIVDFQLFVEGFGAAAPGPSAVAP